MVHITQHSYGSWSAPTYTPAPTLDADAYDCDPVPLHFVTITRMCTGAHDATCHDVQRQIFGPVAVLAAYESAPVIWICPDCERPAPLAASHAFPDNFVRCCVWCDRDPAQPLPQTSVTSAEAVSTLAALHTASLRLEGVSSDSETAALSLLTGGVGTLRTVLEQAAWAVKEDPARASATGMRLLAEIARVINANAVFSARIKELKVVVCDECHEEECVCP